MKKKTINSLQDHLKRDYILRSEIDKIEKVKPYVDTETGTVHWGTDKENKR